MSIYHVIQNDLFSNHFFNYLKNHRKLVKLIAFLNKLYINFLINTIVIQNVLLAYKYF